MSTLDHVIALDGPSGSGKSTIAKSVAQKLSLLYLNTGAMYRALGIVLKERGYEVENSELALASELLSMKFEYGVSAQVLIRIDGQDLTQEIQKHEVSALASMVSKNSDVRAYLKDRQRDLAATRPSILDGRDIGTVIFPDALLKIFLTASPEVRAKRRLLELEQRGHQDLGFDQILKDIKERDYQDMNRDIAPLKKASDSIEIDASHLAIDEVIDRIVSLYQERVHEFKS